jgi:hypothetical protein
MPQERPRDHGCLGPLIHYRLVGAILFLLVDKYEPDGLQPCPLTGASRTNVGHRGKSEKCHVWTAPSWQGETARRFAGRCGHVFGLFVRFT